MAGCVRLAVVALFAVLTIVDCQETEVIVSPERRLVAAGKDVGFECGYKLPPGHSFSSVIWQHSKTGTQLPADRTQTTQDGILILRRVSEADSGVYTCAVQTIARGRVYRNWAHGVLTVVANQNINRVRPSVTVFPNGELGGLTRVRRGSSIELHGLATGHPLPFVTWRRASGKPLPPGRHLIANGKLTIMDTQVPEDVDEYLATATNTQGSDSTSRYLIGGWAAWSDWGMCTVSCGEGQQSRTRQCVLPSRFPARFKSRACQGQLDSRTNIGMESRRCNPGRCPPPPTTPPAPTTTPYRPPTRSPVTRRVPTPTTRRPVFIPVTTVQPTTRPKPTQPPVAAGFGLKYAGCFKDHVARRVLRYHSRNFWRYRQTMTPRYCVQHCQRFGHSFAGVENGVECFCGYMDTRTAIRSNACTTPCGGNAGLECGGVNALSVYEVDQSSAVACQTTKWGRWTELKETCGWAVQTRTRTLRNPKLYCANVPRLRMQRLIKVKPCPPDRSYTPPTCSKVSERKRLTYGLLGNACTSINDVTLNYCKGGCSGRRCTYHKATSENIPFQCGNQIVHLRIGKILSCRCR